MLIACASVPYLLPACCLPRAAQSVTRMCWHPTEPLVFTACLDGASRCWDLRTNSCVRTYGGHEDAVQDIAISADGTMLLTGSDDGTARVYKVKP